MIARFTYKCRICSGFFYDPGKPEFAVDNVADAERILHDSLRQNPTAKKRAAFNETHLCSSTEGSVVMGVGDLVGYRLLEQGPAEAPQAEKTPFTVIEGGG